MSEQSAVQKPMIRYATEVGWKYVKPEEALRLRGGETGRFFRGVLEAQLLRLNPEFLDVSLAGEVLRQLDLLVPRIEGNRDALAWMQGKQSLFIPSQKRTLNIRLIDFGEVTNNIWQVTDEWSCKGTIYTNRADVVFLINGLPVAIAETKKAGLPDGLSIGIDQIRRYHRETPEMVTLPQTFEVTQLLDFYYGATWSLSRKNIFNWKEVVSGDYENKVKHFFDQRSFLRLLRDYILFLSRDDELSKVILRQHQVRAVEKVTQRIAEGTKRHGLIWHTQGSGKTLTMISIASRLLTTQEGEKPLVVMIVDRNELESQLFKNISAYGMGSFKVARSKRDLQDILDSDYRGLVVSMIHKFDQIRANSNTRRNVVVLVDEAHRSTGGDLGNYLMGALPNATYIGFTGTPIDRLSKGQGTFKVFGKDDAQGYLDKYSIAESIEDGTTVKLNYALAPSDLRVDPEVLEREFLDLADAEGVSDIEELNTILDRAVELKEVMKSRQRIDTIARYVAEHFSENVNPMGFKAFLVAVDREACAFYKEALDTYLPPDWSEVVYSSAHNDSAELKKYALSEEDEKKIRRNFLKREKLPKILIVTEKLLTGFDAPILYCMYLDKPMRDHVLLQAIARVNRPYEEDGRKKAYGFVLDFVGIFEKLERALAFDSDVVGSVIQNIDVLKQLFATMMKEATQEYLPWTRGWNDKAKERAVAHFEDKKRREAFFTFFRKLQNLYEVLSPDSSLRPYLETYKALTELFTFLWEAFSDRPYADKELTDKTRFLLHQYATSENLQLPGVIRELGPKELALLKESQTTETVKLLNLRRLLSITVEQKSRSQPYLQSIGERAERIIQAYEDRHLTTQQALSELETLAQTAADAQAEQERLGLDANTFAVYNALRLAIEDAPIQLAKDVNSVFVRYPDYQWDEREGNEARADLYHLLRPYLATGEMIEAVNRLLDVPRV